MTRTRPAVDGDGRGAEGGDLGGAEAGGDEGEEGAVAQADGPAAAHAARGRRGGGRRGRARGGGASEGIRAGGGRGVGLWKEVVAPRQVRLTVPVSPWRCLAMMISAWPRRVGSVGGVDLGAVDEGDLVGVLFDGAGFGEVGELGARDRCAG